MANISDLGQYKMEEEEEDMNSVLPVVVDKYPFSDCSELDPNLFSKEESGSNSSEKVEEEETSVITSQIDDDDESTSLDSISGVGEVNESSSDLLLLSLTRKLVVELFEFHVHMVILFCIFPVWLLHVAYTFLVDPFGFIAAGKHRLAKLLSRIWVFSSKILFPFILTWVKRHRLVLIKLASNFGWGLIWASYFGLLLAILLVSALIITSLIMRILVTEPIHMKETLTFDYTKHSPVAYVPITFENEKIHHKFQVTVSMTMPESDYNRNLGIFQIRLDFLSMDGEIVASSSLPCMLRFRSEPVRLLYSILKAASVVAGYSSESQTIEVKFRNMEEVVELSSIAWLRVSMEQRAEFQKGAGIPELYDSFVLVESEFSLVKRIICQWRTAIFIWISMTVFVMEMMFSLLFRRYIPTTKSRTSHGCTMS